MQDFNIVFLNGCMTENDSFIFVWLYQQTKEIFFMIEKSEDLLFMFNLWIAALQCLAALWISLINVKERLKVWQTISSVYLHRKKSTR